VTLNEGRRVAAASSSVNPRIAVAVGAERELTSVHFNEIWMETRKQTVRQ